MVREHSADWRESGYPGTTAETKLVLSHWLEESDPGEGKLYFVQQHAILSSVYLDEGQEHPGHQQVSEALDKATNPHPPPMGGLRRICHKMATGADKIAVMATLIVYHPANHTANPDALGFAGWALALWPNLTVRRWLEASLIPDPAGQSDEYGQRNLLPPLSV